MHPFCELYNIVNWTPLLTNQDNITRYLGSHPPFRMVFKMVAMEKDKMPLLCNISLLPSVTFNCMSEPSIFKTLNSISDIKS